MKIRIKTDAKSDPILRDMAESSGMPVEQLAEVAVYNLIALYVAEKGNHQLIGDIDVARPAFELDNSNL